MAAVARGYKSLRCKCCSTTFDLPDEYEEHIILPHHSFFCTKCDYSNQIEDEVSLHMWTHRNERPFRCPCCENSYIHYHSLEIHLRINHPLDFLSYCQFCKKAFRDVINHGEHESTHFGQKPYVCLSCGKTYAKSSSLLAHFRSHVD